MRIKNKKSQVFVIITIILITLFFISFGVYSNIQERSSVRNRISTMDSFLFSLEKDLERQMYVVGFRGLFLAEVNITNTGNYTENITQVISNAFFNNLSYDEFCNESDLNISVMCGARYIDILYGTNGINYRAEKMNIKVNITEPEIEIFQADPWHVGVRFIFNLTMEDKSDLASWSKTENITGLVNIEGLEDPLFIIETNAEFPSNINRTKYSGIYTDGISDVENLTQHLESGYYTQNDDAPSFLMRLQGNFSADPEGNGIERLVDLSAVPESYRYPGRTVVDYLYFTTSIQGEEINYMPSWFALDSEHHYTYNITFDLLE
jgi:hypothetical protein